VQTNITHEVVVQTNTTEKRKCYTERYCSAILLMVFNYRLDLERRIYILKYIFIGKNKNGLKYCFFLMRR